MNRIQTTVLQFMTGLSLATAPVLTMANVALTSISDTEYSVVQDSLNPVALSKLQFEHLSHSQQNEIAGIWGLTPTDYQHYLWTMHHTPAGHWYANLNPAEVLLLTANTQAERQRLAQIVVKTTYERGQHELAAEVAYNQAWQALYPTVPRVVIPGHNTFKPVLRSGDTLVYFTQATAADSQLPTLWSVLSSHPGVNLTLYFEGHPSQAQVESWANQQHIPLNLYQAGRIRLVIDHGYFAQLTHHTKDLPLLALEHQGHLSVIALNDLVGEE